MLHNKSILAIVPARGKSKGIPRKNLSVIRGKSLIRYAAETLKQVDFIDHCVVSTDDEKIKEEAIRFGLEVPFYRPEALSGDLISDLQVLQHAIHASQEYYHASFDIILMVQPTCPLRKPQHIIDCVNTLVNEGADAAWTVTEVDLKNHPLKQLSIKSGVLQYYACEGKHIIARQQLAPTYIRNGACYAWKKNVLMGPNADFLPSKSSAVIIKDKLIDIDHPEDITACEITLSP